MTPETAGSAGQDRVTDSAATTLHNASVEMRHEGVEWMTALADLLQSESVWAHDVGRRYPDDRAPLLVVATKYLQGLPADHPLFQAAS